MCFPMCAVKAVKLQQSCVTGNSATGYAVMGNAVTEYDSITGSAVAVHAAEVNAVRGYDAVTGNVVTG